MVKNWGTEDAIAVKLQGFHCKTYVHHAAETTVLRPQEDMRFTLDVEPEDVARAWITVIWRTPASASTGRGAWFPVRDDGDLAEVLQRQVDRSWVRRKAIVWLSRSVWPTTLSIPSGKVPVGMPMSPKQAAAHYGAKTVAQWRMWLAAKLIGPPNDAAIAAVMEIELGDH